MAENDAEPTQKTHPRGTDKQGRRYKPADIPIPTRGEFDSFVRKVAGPAAGRKRPAEKDPPPEQSD